MWGKIRRRRADILFSQYLRKKRNYRCEYCGLFFPDGVGLQISHFHKRRKESVRFDEENCDVFCVRDHAYFEAHQTEYEAWKKDKLGERAFDLLTLRANRTQKKDDRLILMWLKQVMEG